MKLTRAMALLALRPSQSPSPTELALSSVIGVSTQFALHAFTKMSTCLGVAFECYTILRQLESPVEVRGFMIVRLPDQRFLHLVLL